MRIDHVTIAGRDLDALRQQFHDLGLVTAYGGAHANGVTHMATLGFADGSYLELISTLQPGQSSPWWDPFIRSDAGPCAWAIEVEDVSAQAQRVRDAGIPVRGPIPMGRSRPDGRQVEWDLAFPGEGEPGTHLPFIIRDRTPRDWRITPSPAPVAADQPEASIMGVARVIAVVRSLDAAQQQYRQAFGLDGEQVMLRDQGCEVRAVNYQDAPLTLIEPAEEGCAYASDRLRMLGPSPIAFLLGANHLEAAVERFNASPPVEYLGIRVAWLIKNQLGLMQLPV